MVSQNNDGNYYEIAVDTAKEGAEVWSLNNWFKARVGDDGTPLVMRFYTQGQLNSFDGHQKPIIQGNVGAYSLDENKQIVMAADAKVVSWTGDPSDMLPGGRVLYHFPQQMFPTEGAFYGFVGYVDESNGRRLTGVNVWFRVLGGVAQMGRACDFYINDLDIALANAKEKMRQQSADFDATLQVALQDLRDKYKAEVQANQDMSLQARQSLSELADTAGRISAQIKAQDIVTKAQFATELANNRSYADGKFGEMMDKIGDATPHFIASAEMLKSTYPTGTKGLWVTQDTGERYVYNNGTWTSFGPYQGQGIANKTITNQMIADKTIEDNVIGMVHLSSVQDSYLSIGEATIWNGSKTDVSISIDKDGAGLARNDTTKRDFGIFFPVHLPFMPTEDLPVYIDFSFAFDDTSGLQNKLDLYITQVDGTLIRQVWTSGDKNGYDKVKLNPQDFTSGKFGQDFAVLFAIHGGTGSIKVRPTVSFNSDNVQLPIRFKQLGDLIETNKAGIDVWDSNSWVDPSKIKSTSWDLSTAILWNAGPYDALHYQQGEVIKTSGDLSRNSGLAFTGPVKPDQTNYIKIVCGAFGDIPGDTPGIIASPTPGIVRGKYRSLGGSGNNAFAEITAELTPAAMSALTISDTLTIVIGGKASNIVVKSIMVSTLPTGQTLPGAIKALRETIGSDDGYQANGQNPNGLQSANLQTIDGLDLATAGTPYQGKNGRLKRLRAYVKKGGHYKFVVGKMDQHNLLVDSNAYDIILDDGYNELDVYERGIKVSNGDYVFMDVSSAGVYTPDSTNLRYATAYLRDSSHPSTYDGYPGQMFYTANVLVPFDYSVASASLNTQISDLGAAIADSNDKISQAAAKKAKGDLLIAPSSKQYRLVVGDDGGLSTAPVIPEKVTIFGNSLTKNAGGIGMAASDQNHDWYHLVSQYLKKANPSVQINDRTNVSDWESGTSTEARDQVFTNRIKPLLAADTDLVIIQLVDNVNRDEKHATFANDAQKLLANIRSVSPKAQVLWVAGWFLSYDDLIPSIKAACDKYGAKFVDTTPYRANHSHVGATRTALDGHQWQIVSSGEAAHPDDTGMQLIANAVIGNLDF